VSLEDIDAVRILFRAYAQSIAHVHCFPDFEEELAQLHIAYASPGGGLRLALVEGQPAGCCAFRPLPDTDHAYACEMKRLFVAPSHRGLGLGLRLVESVMDAARIGGYSCMLLDTLSEMEAARQLYDEIGFVEIAPYMQSPIPGAHHLKVTL
jgi:GNAT superfamily N-acetyltransferase